MRIYSKPLQTTSSHFLKEQSTAARVFAKLKTLRLGRMARLLILGRELRFADKIKLNYRREYQPLQIIFAGKPLQVLDANSFLGAYKEIFLDRVYEFFSTTPRPFIIDCGANIGLATIFFKQLYPDSRVIAFEPDPVLFAALEQNIASFQMQNVEAINAAVWNNDTPIAFVSEGGASGHIATSREMFRSTLVAAAQLRSWLRKKVDFLKLDVEGAEYAVLEDCREELGNVQNLFVEYHSAADSKQTLPRLLEIISAAGFRYHIHEAFTSPHPFLSRRLLGQMDLQLNISAFRPESNPSHSISSGLG